MIRWYDSIVFRMLLFFILFAIILSLSMIGTFSMVSKEELRENAYTKAILTSEKIVATLEKAQIRIEELTTLLASVAETFDLDHAKNKAVVQKILETGGHTNVVSGGVWFEPFALETDRERLSYFFAKDKKGRFSYIDDYNANGPEDYHKKEWYVPIRYMAKDHTYWSRVYIDPHTHVPMVTASVGMYKAEKFIGVATIDIKLEGLDDYLAEEVKVLQGYALLIDREGKFIAYPKQLDIEVTDPSMQDIHSVRSPRFLPLAQEIQKDMDDDVVNDDRLTRELVDQSDEIDIDEARIISSILRNDRQNISLKRTHKRFMLHDDYILDEDAFVTIFTIPTNRWRLIIALPASKAFAQSIKIYQDMLVITILMTLFTSILGYLFIRKIAVIPMKEISLQLQKSLRRKDRTGLLKSDDKGELGNLVYWFNQRSKALHEKYKEVKALNQEIEETQKEVVFTMGAIGESRSKETGNHVKRVAEYSRLLARYYGLGEKEAEMLKQASPMHDIGKVAIPDAVLNKPEPFDVADRKIMDTHAALGHEMLKYSSRPLLNMASIVAYEHHEKWDGSGYPRGLKGEEIDIYGRITALADVFDALGSARVYKPAWDDERIFKLFKEQRGKHFDPRLVDIFFEHLDEFLAIRDSMKDVFDA